MSGKYLRKKTCNKIVWPVQVIMDDREKKPFKLDEEKFEVTRSRLDTGDYLVCIPGYDGIVVEKKENLEEILQNVSVRYRKTFVKFLERLSCHTHKCMIICDSIDNAQRAISRVPTGMTVYSLYWWLNTIQFKYGIPIVFTGRNNKSVIASITLERLIESAING